MKDAIRTEVKGIDANKLKQLRAIIIRYKILCRVDPPAVKGKTATGLFYESQFTTGTSKRWTGRKLGCQ